MCVCVCVCASTLTAVVAVTVTVVGLGWDGNHINDQENVRSRRYPNPCSLQYSAMILVNNVRREQCQQRRTDMYFLSHKYSYQL